MGFRVYGNLTWVFMLSYGKIALYYNICNVNSMGVKPYEDFGSMKVLHGFLYYLMGKSPYT